MAISLPNYQEPLIIQSLNSCNSMQELKQIQSIVTKTKRLQTQLIYSKIFSFCALSPHGNISYARYLLAHFKYPTISMYNVVIRGISLNKSSSTLNSMCIYQELLEMGLYPNNYTFTSLIKCCADFDSYSEGKLLHALVVKLGFELDSYVRNNLIRFYCTCGEIDNAHKLFDRFVDRNFISWTILISGYSKLGLLKEAISTFIRMMDENLLPDAVTIATVVSACAKIKDMEMCKKLCKYIDVHELKFDNVVENSLVDMYSKCGDVNSAYMIFKKMRKRNVVSWNSMISGFVQNGEHKKALSMFRKMQNEGLDPDEMTLVSVLSACACLGALELGEWVHSYIKMRRMKGNGTLGNALVDMYAKCGTIDQAMQVFNNMSNQDVYAYTSLIGGLAMNCETQKALNLFYDMSIKNIKPNAITFIGVLSACSHGGLVHVGLSHFADMLKIYKITPQIEHYGCVVDMLGKAGLLYEAQDFIYNMPIKPDALVFGSLLGACMVHENVDLGEKVALKLLESSSIDDGVYVLISNLYAFAKKKGNVKHVRKVMENRKLKKTPGCSLIEVNGVVHEFRMRDKSSPCNREVYRIAEDIQSHLKGGYNPSCVLDELLQVHSW